MTEPAFTGANKVETESVITKYQSSTSPLCPPTSFPTPPSSYPFQFYLPSVFLVFNIRLINLSLEFVNFFFLCRLINSNSTTWRPLFSLHQNKSKNADIATVSTIKFCFHLTKYHKCFKFIFWLNVAFVIFWTHSKRFLS